MFISYLFLWSAGFISRSLLNYIMQKITDKEFQDALFTNPDDDYQLELVHQILRQYRQQNLYKNTKESLILKTKHNLSKLFLEECFTRGKNLIKYFCSNR